MRIQGQRLYIFSGNRDNLFPVASSTDCSISLESEAIAGVRRKGVRVFRRGKKTWSVSNAGFLTPQPDIKNLIGQPLTVAISVLQKELVDIGIIPGHAYPLDKEVTLIGQVIGRNISLDGSRGGISTASMEYIGVGELGMLAYRNGFPYILPLVF